MGSETPDLYLDLPAGLLRLRGLGTAEYHGARSRYAAHVRTGPAADAIPCDVVVAENVGLPAGTPVFDLHFRYGSERVVTTGYGFETTLVPAPSVSALMATRLAGEPLFEGALENTLRVIAAYALLLRDGLLVHSTAFVADGRAWILAGHSGAGKSTLAACAADAGLPILSDDLNALWIEDDRVMTRAVPFAGTHESTADTGVWPVGGLFALEKGERLVCDHPGRAFVQGRVLGCAPFVNRDPCRLAGVQNQVERLCHRLATGRLRVPRRPRMDELVALLNT